MTIKRQTRKRKVDMQDMEDMEGEGLKEIAGSIYNGAKKVGRFIKKHKLATKAKAVLKFTGLDSAVPGFVNKALDVGVNLGAGQKGVRNIQPDQFHHQYNYLKLI